MKPTPAMITAVKGVLPSERLAAIRLAEATFFKAFNRFESWGDFSTDEHRTMAGRFAAAEVRFHFA